jgi:putative ABC transport system permease protein
MAWYRRLTNLFRSQRHSRDLDREMGFHLAERADELIASGMPEAEARREAGRRFGNRGAMKERTRDADVLAWLDALLADLRQAVRALRSNRGFAFVAVLSLGLGIGANTAIFSLINTVMLKSLPVRHPETLLKVTMGKDGGDNFTNPIWEQVRGHPELFAGAFATGQDRFNLAQGGEARPVDGEWVSGDYFATLGVPAILGRTIARTDDVRGCPAIAVLGYGLWQADFGGARDAIGKSLMVNSHAFTVVGVVDRAFFGVEVGRHSQLYLPICSEPAVDGGHNVIDDRGFWFLSIMARPAAGMTVAQTGARLAAVAPDVFQATMPPNGPAEVKATYRKRTLAVVPAGTGYSELRLQYAGALRVLMVVVALVLLIACANAANLLLARATVRQHEAAIRLALGAGRGRLIRLMLTEAMLLSLLGAALGVIFASWGTRVLTGFLSVGDNAAWLDLAIDRRVLAFTMLAALFSGVLFGLAPAWRSAQADPQAALKAQGRSVVGHSRRRVGWALVAGQVALSFILLTSAGLLLNSFHNLMSAHAGFQRSGVLLIDTELTDTSATLRSGILERLRALPGVRSAAFSTMTPLGNSGEITFLVSDGFDPAHQQPARSGVNHISGDYFTTMGTRLLRGRDVGPADNAGSTQVALVTQSMAHELFGSTDPIGRECRQAFGDKEGAPFEVIGVVEDSKFGSLRDSTGMMIYLPAAQGGRPLRGFTLELRSDVAPTSLVRGVKGVMAELSPTASLRFTTLSDQVARSLSRDRLLATLATFFGGLALLLALIGLYGTMSYNVARRKNEIGIRIALGAARERVIRMVIGEVGVVVVAGLGIGVVLALAATRLVASLLFGLTASDPATWIGSAGILLGVALLAGAAPAWRAARMTPMTALREE